MKNLGRKTKYQRIFNIYDLSLLIRRDVKKHIVTLDFKNSILPIKLRIRRRETTIIYSALKEKHASQQQNEER